VPDVPARSPSPFNGPVESGLRSLVLLNAAAPAGCDLGRLVVYDYLLVHSKDVPGGPDSLHPATPHRSGELLVRRKMIQSGLMLMVSRELVSVEYGAAGIVYTSTKLSGPFLEYLQNEYSNDMRKRADWVVSTFGSYTDDSLIAFAMSHLSDWAGELVNDSLLRRNEG
jgi:hypothetical protein